MKITHLQEKLLVIFISTGIFFLAGEIVIRVYTKYHPIYDLEMTRYALLLKQDSTNPLIGHLHKPNEKVRLMNVDVSINSDGFRDKEYTIKKNSKYRIIFLGDSITFGWGVSQNETFSNILETEINKSYPTEILNFGTGNYNTEQEVNLFLEKGLKYNPDKVVVFYFINDTEVTPKKSYLEFLGYSQLFTFYWSNYHKILGRVGFEKNYKDYYSDLYKENQVGWQHAQKAFLRLKEITQQKKVALQVIILPELHNLTDYPFKREHQIISSFFTQNQIQNLDLLPFLNKWNHPELLWVAKDDAHPNRLGHQLIARYSLDFISKKS